MGIKDEVQGSSTRGISNYFNSASSESPSKKVLNSRPEYHSNSFTRKTEQNFEEGDRSLQRDDSEEIGKLGDSKRQKIEMSTKQDTNVDQSFLRVIEEREKIEGNESDVEVVLENREQEEADSFICHCPLCGKNITAFSASDKNSHVDRCCNSDNKISTPMKEPKKTVTSKSKSSEAKKVGKGSIQNYFLSTPP